MLCGLVVNLVTRMVPSEKGGRFCRIAWGFVAADFLILFWNLFSEKIYFIDEYNIYHRAEWFPLSQIAGLACVAVGVTYLIRFRKSAQRRVIVLFSVFAALCAAALITQIFIYGIAWLNIAALIGLVIIFVYNQMFIAESLADKRKIIAEQNLLIEQERTQLCGNCGNHDRVSGYSDARHARHGARREAAVRSAAHQHHFLHGI